MKIIGADAAASVLILPLDDVRPAHGVTAQQVIDSLVAKYKFASKPRAVGGVPIGFGGGPSISAPSSGVPAIQMLFQMALSLQNGIAEINDEQTIIIARIDVLRDLSRIIVQTITTEEGDLVLNDVSTMLESTFKFRNLKDLTARQYVSNVVIQFEKGIEDHITLLREIQNIISPAMKRANQVNQEVGLERIVFTFDPTQLPASKSGQVGSFILERRIQHPYSDNRYFSSAPLRTREHIDVLEQIGTLLEGQRLSV